MKNPTLLLLFTFLLSSCAPAATMTSVSTPTKTITTAPTATQTPSPTPTLIPTPTQIGGGSGKLIFEYYKVAYEKSFPDLKGQLHVFTSNLDGVDLTPITNGLQGVNHIESISSDGSQVLVSSFSDTNYVNGDLYLIDLNSGKSAPLKIAKGLSSCCQSAKWVDNTHIVYIGNGKSGHGIYIVSIDDISNPKKISKSNPISIVSVDSTRVYWNNFVNENFKDNSGFLYAYGSFNALWWTNIDGSGEGKLESNGKQVIPYGFTEYAFSPDSKSIAWIPAEKGPDCMYENVLASWIRDGVYTKYAGQSAPGVFDKNRSDFGKTIDMAYIKAEARQCYIMYVASLSDIDNPVRVVLLPPDNFFNLEFTFGRTYELNWYPDGSKITLFYQGFNGGKEYGNYHASPVLFSAKPTGQNSTLSPVYSFPGSDSLSVLGFSPDGQQILVGNYSQGSYINILKLGTMKYIGEFGSNMTPDAKIQRIGNIYWLP